MDRIRIGVEAKPTTGSEDGTLRDFRGLAACNLEPRNNFLQLQRHICMLSLVDAMHIAQKGK